ncbi:MAG: AsmA-like C-terminal region-containing protein [bacterium]|nr:AsmA-like C-terminal region-containing protein [bacterium]
MKKLKYTYFYTTITVIIFITVYMFLTSNLFLNNFLLKTISSDMGIKISVKKIDLSLFNRELIITDYHIDKSDTFFIEGEKIKCKFSLLALIKKELYIKELIFNNSRISIYSKHQDLLIGNNSTTKISGKFFNKISFNNLSFNNSSLGIFKLLSNNGKNKILSIDDISFKLPVFTDNEFCKASFVGNFCVESENSKYKSSGKILSDINIFVDKNFNPLYINLNSKITDIRGFIENISFKNHNIILKTKIEINNGNLRVKSFKLKEYLKNELLSDIHLKGIIKYYPAFFDIGLNINSISGELLNTFSALLSDYQFIDSTRLNFAGRCLYKDEKFSSKGNLHINKLSIPEKKIENTDDSIVNVDFKYDFSTDIKEKVITVNDFNLKIKAPDNGKIDLYSKGKNVLDFKNNNLNLHKIDGMVFHSYNFNLDYVSNLLWNIFGIEDVNGRLNVVMGISGVDNNLMLKGPVEITSLMIKKGNFFVDNLNLKNNISCSLTEKFKIIFDDVSGILSKNNKKISQIKIKGLYDINSDNGILDISIPYVNYKFLDIFLGDNRESNIDKLIAENLDDISLCMENRFKFNLDRKIFLVDKLDIKLKKLNKVIADVETYQPLQFQLKNNEVVLADKLVRFKIKSNEYDLTSMNKYIPINIDKGKFNSQIDGEIYNDYKKIKLSGIFKIVGITFDVNNEQFKDLTISNQFDLKFTDLKNIELKSSRTELFKNKGFILSVLTTGNYNINEKIGKLKTTIVESNLAQFDEVSERYLKPHGIELLKVSGDLLFEFKNGFKELVSSGKFIGDELVFTNSDESKTVSTLSGKLDYKIKRTSENLKIEPLNLKINKDSDKLLDISLNALIPHNLKENIEIKLYSSNLNLEKIIGILINLDEGTSENNRINLKNINTIVNIYLENIYYGPFLKMDLDSKLTVKNGYLTLDPTILNLNKTPVYLKGDADFSKKGKLPFKFDVDFYDLNIVPFLKTYDEKVYEKSKGSISKFDLSLNGDLLNKKSLLSSLKGKLKASSKNLSIPFDFNKFDFMRILFIPFEVMTKVSGAFSGSNVPIFFANLMHFSNNIFTNARNLDIEHGDLLLAVDNRKIYIDEFTLNAVNSPMKSLNISGKLGFDGSINIIETIVGNNNFILPLVVKGSVDKPIPDNIKYIKLINANILSPLKTVFWNALNFPVNAVDNID